MWFHNECTVNVSMHNAKNLRMTRWERYRKWEVMNFSQLAVMKKRAQTDFRRNCDFFDNAILHHMKYSVRCYMSKTIVPGIKTGDMGNFLSFQDGRSSRWKRHNMEELLVKFRHCEKFFIAPYEAVRSVERNAYSSAFDFCYGYKL